MKFRLYYIGSKSDTDFGEAADRYRKRIGHFFPIEIVQVRGEKRTLKRPDEELIRSDSRKLLEAVEPKSLLIVLDERGEALSSLKFAKWIEKAVLNHPYGASFVIGGEVGLSEEIRNKAHKVLALSPMTLPHQLARVVLLEQIYRACTMIRNVPYHK